MEFSSKESRLTSGWRVVGGGKWEVGHRWCPGHRRGSNTKQSSTTIGLRASPTNAPAAQFFGPHVACHVREGRFLIAGAPMLRREQSGKSRALQGGRLSRRRSRILGSGRLGAESGAAGEEGQQQQQASAHLCLGGRPHTFYCCVQATSAPIQISHFGTHPQRMCSILYPSD